MSGTVLASVAWDESAAKAEVSRLVGEYEQAKSEGRLSRYGDNRFGEESTKKDFILPLFRALGWRVEDSREVSAEERVLRGRADYGFKIGGVTKFYVEAKALSKNLMEREHLQQVIDYSYAKGAPWAVLTNFAQTAVLYSEAKVPNPRDCQFFVLSASEYISGFDRLRLLSKPAIGAKELDSKAEQFGRKPKKQPIDKQLLKDLNSFRLDLAKDVGRLNHDLFLGSDEALEETVQRILDRLIFIRVAEDRGLEDKQLTLLSQGPDSTAVRRLRELFRRYDQNFDSKLFQPHAADDVRMDGEVLQRVLRGLHQTEDESIRYDFGAIDADVLGVMYEQYLGLILRQTPKRAKLSDGKVNRKEQGIYYTPTWVVDYIVKFAIEEALKRKGAKADRLRVLDPACGSGTFLLRAFDHLMRARNPSGASVQSRFDPENAGPLLALRTSVLTDNLFGVDLDARAVEIAQLNLMIRAAESRHRLPTLERNVRVGNSVIADPSVDARALDWTKAFPEPMGEGGFDVVVTNPPYVRIQNLDEAEVDYFGRRFSVSGDYDLYTLFVQQAWELLREGGVAGFILPNKFLTADYGQPLREFLAERGAIQKLSDFRDYQVFDGATTYTCLLFLRKGAARKRFLFGSLLPESDPSLSRNLSDEQFAESEVGLPKAPSESWTLLPAESRPLFERLGAVSPRLADLRDAAFQGLKTGCDEVYFVRLLRQEAGIATVRSQADEREYRVERALLRPVLKGKEVRRWSVVWDARFVLFPYEPVGARMQLIPLAELERRFPLSHAYFRAQESLLKRREHGRMGEEREWHQFSRLQNLDKFQTPKILVQETSDRNRFFLDSKGTFCFVASYGIHLKERSEEGELYTLGVLNSRPVEFYLQSISTHYRGGFYAYRTQYLDPLPIPRGTPASRAAIASVAKELTEVHSRLGGLVEATDRYKEALREIEELEARLDRLTLDLFEISTDEEKLLPALPKRMS